MNYDELIDAMMETNDAMLLGRRGNIYRSLVDMKNRLITDLSGDIVECGIWRGLTVAFLANLYPDNHIWACDSFQGCPHDASQMQFHKLLARDLSEHKGAYAEPLAFLEANLKLYNVAPERVSILKGWFKDTLNPDTCPIQKISVLRIDGDMYSSTMEVLVNLYPKVVVGGAVIFDDWCLGASRAAAMDFMSEQLSTFPQLYDPDNGNNTPISIEHANHNDGGLQGLFFIKGEQL